MLRFYGKLNLRVYLHSCSTGRPRIDFREWDMGIDSWLTDLEKKEIFLIVLAIQIILDVIKQIKELIDNY